MLPKTFSISTIIDIALASPHERVKRVADTRDLYQRSEEFPFDPDYYRPVKEGLERLLKEGRAPGWLTEYLSTLALKDVKRRNAHECAGG